MSEDEVTFGGGIGGGRGAKHEVAEMKCERSDGKNVVAMDTTGVAPATQQSQSQTEYTAEYLSQLLMDKKKLASFPGVFGHLDRLVDEDPSVSEIFSNPDMEGEMASTEADCRKINKVRVSLFQFEFTNEALDLPESDGSVVNMQEKIYMPTKEYPDFNFVGRILGPRGMTAKQLEQETGCKIMVRGRGSMRDKRREEANRGKQNWEHLNDHLHVLVQCEDAENRCRIKIDRAVAEIKKLLMPAPDGEDELKRKQLMELAIINGTYRPSNPSKFMNNLFPLPDQPRLYAQLPLAGVSPLRSPLGAAASLVLSPTRPNNISPGALAPTTMITPLAAQAMLNGMNVVTSSPSGGAVPLPSISPDPFAASVAPYLYGDLSSILDPTTTALASSYGYNVTSQPLLGTGAAASANVSIGQDIGLLAQQGHLYTRN